MKKYVWIGIGLLAAVGLSLFGYFAVAGSEAEPAPVKWEGEVTQEEKEKVGKVIDDVLQKDFSENIEWITYQPDQEALVVQTTFQKSDVQEALAFDEAVLKKAGDKKKGRSYQLILNYDNGVPFSTAVIHKD
ncbi:hypothetical protein [Halobacillus sp. BAB-2008]|uniref:hypothetical protein n=1 Tax=Halobacillus sp. BAB-2008 TaxID=1246484 RepID=UPI0012677787|nr:hypothetical protein [Halobacillus sp. BAB-2008]